MWACEHGTTPYLHSNPNSLSRWLHSGSSNMAVIEVPMISGFRADVESLERVSNYINAHTSFRDCSTNTVPQTPICYYCWSYSTSSQVGGSTERKVERKTDASTSGCHLMGSSTSWNLSDSACFLWRPQTHVYMFTPLQDASLNKHTHTWDMNIISAAQWKMFSCKCLSEQEAVKCLPDIPVIVVYSCCTKEFQQTNEDVSYPCAQAM